MSNVYDYLDEIAGAQLSAITFVMDYYQFHFDGPVFNVLTPVTVDSEAGRAMMPPRRTSIIRCPLSLATRGARPAGAEMNSFGARGELNIARADR